MNDLNHNTNNCKDLQEVYEFYEDVVKTTPLKAEHLLGISSVDNLRIETPASIIDIL